jgi:anti-sigma B factor antagonist
MSASSPGALTVSSVVENGVASIFLRGELDLASAPQVEECLASVLERAPTRIVVDLGQLAFIDSTGLRLLLQADGRAKEHGYELVLRPADPSVQRVFEVAGALDALRFEPSE